MAKRPKDLDKIHKKYYELREEKGKEFASGFFEYMFWVDYEKRDPDQALFTALWTLTPYDLRFGHFIKMMFKGDIQSDIVDGFRFGEKYSREVNYTYID